MDLAVQPKLLKVLEEKRFRRVGDVRERTVDVRFIAAANQDLARRAEEKTFRQDLLYRINTVTLHVPALRERPRGHSGARGDDPRVAGARHAARRSAR